MNGRVFAKSKKGANYGLFRFGNEGERPQEDSP